MLLTPPRAAQVEQGLIVPGGQLAGLELEHGVTSQDRRAASIAMHACFSHAHPSCIVTVMRRGLASAALICATVLSHRENSREADAQRLTDFACWV
jgi:hypothetical protein